MDRIVLPWQGIHPTIPESAFLAPGCVVIGDVVLGEHASVWFGSVVRGDVHWIRIGERTNIQDGCVLHVTGGTHPMSIAERVTVGHGVVLHGCTIAAGSLIGIGARVLDGASVGERTLVGAGSLVAPGAVIPGGVLALGTPAKVVRTLSADELEHLAEAADHYVEYAAAYRSLLAAGPGR